MKYRIGKGRYRHIEEGYEKEWLIGNGVGGFSNCTVTGDLSRIHAGYLIASLNHPVDRIKILAKTQEEVIYSGERTNLDTQVYEDSVSQGYRYLEAFEYDRIAKYIYRINDMKIEKSISSEYGKNTVAVCYEVTAPSEDGELIIVPDFSCRDNSSVYENILDMKLSCEVDGNLITVVNNNDNRYTVQCICSAGEVVKRDDVYIEGLCYSIDKRNGFDGSDCLYTPVEIRVPLKKNQNMEFYLKCTIEDMDDKTGFDILDEYVKRTDSLIDMLPYKDEFTQRLAISSDAFIVDRQSTGLKTILAGFPWFTDWGRDTMIAITGLTLCTGRYKDNEEILESFSKYLNNGLIPNMFPSTDDEKPIYNTVDASLWYFYAVDRYLDYTGHEENYNFIQEKIYPCLKEIVKAYRQGTDFSIGMDDDGLIHAGSDLDQVTWMDVRVDDWVVTPRHGKPVEINALWYNALMVMDRLSKKYGDNDFDYELLAKKVCESFNARFWNEKEQCLYDVVDENDDRVRPNQIWAVSLPYTMLDRDKERKIVNKVYKELYTCYGLRSLSYKDKEYKASYIGPLSERDAAYHMGTSWAFPMGGFITAYCKVNDYSEESISQAKMMLEAFNDHMNDGCLGAIAEVFDGTYTCTGNGCFSQAWSVGEILRAYMEDVIYKGNIKDIA